jgi:hypothetical protein
MAKKRYGRCACVYCAMPEGVRIYNNCDRPCDRLVGPCVCGDWHGRERLLEICRRKGILTVFIEEAFDEAIRKNSIRMIKDKIARGVPVKAEVLALLAKMEEKR